MEEPTISELSNRIQRLEADLEGVINYIAEKESKKSFFPKSKEAILNEIQEWIYKVESETLQ